MLLTVKQEELARSGKPLMTQAEGAEFERPTREKYEAEGNSASYNTPVEDTEFGIFRM